MNKELEWQIAWEDLKSNARNLPNCSEHPEYLLMCALKCCQMIARNAGFDTPDAPVE